MKRIIFTLTTGRSGTALLSELLKPIHQVHAEHEPKPLFSDAFVYLKTRPQFNVKEFCKIKLNAINQLLEENNKSTYIETCHSFGKGFIEPMLELNSDIEIIILHRDPIQVALSMYRLDDIPGRTKTGIHWYLDPVSKLSLTELSGSELNYTDFQYCYWYTQEMLCQTNQLLHTHPDNIACLIDFRELLCYEYFRNILLKLHLTIPKSYLSIYKSIISNKINEKLYRKHNLSLPIDYQAQIDQVNSDLIVK